MYNRISKLKQFTFYLSFLSILLLLSSCTGNAEPPQAKIIPDSIFVHGETLVDNYSWLKDKTRSDSEIIDHLKAENRYTKSILKSTGRLQKDLVREMRGRIKETDQTVPIKIDDYYYYSRTEKNKQYRIYCRKKGSLTAEEEIYLDLNKLAEGLGFFSIIERNVSPDHKYVAYGVDSTGTEDYKLFIKQIDNEKILDFTEDDIDDIIWANDSKTIFYTLRDQAGRTNRVYRHNLNDPPEKTELIFTESDERYWVGLYRSFDDRYLFINSSSSNTSECRFIDADMPESKFKVIEPRREGHIYRTFSHNDDFYIQTNLEAKNNKLMKTSIADPSAENWQEIIPHRDTVRIECRPYKNHIVIKERFTGSDHLRILKIDDMSSEYLDLPEQAYSIYLILTNFNEDKLRIGYESLSTPYSIFEFDLNTKERKLLKQQQIRGDFNKEDYTTQRLSATARDGVQIPITIVYNKKYAKRENPILLDSYGAYGDVFDPYFSTARLSLIDRGITYGIAHIRGGKDIGEDWYKQGRMMQKMNTFTDLIDCTEFLKNENIAGDVIIQGGSAGGLTVGVACNLRPELFKAVIADVPFVDLINTMLDPTLSAVVSEYEEWGNPNIKEQFDYMLSYSPYENISRQEYPHILAIAGFYDTRVDYWGPAKWVAKLREYKTDENLLLLYTNFSAGHSGASGRFDYLNEIALEYAFILQVLK